MNYSEVFKKAWSTIWKHKVLWIFALFAGALVGGGFNPASNFSYRFSNSSSMNNHWIDRMPQFMQHRGLRFWESMKSVPTLTWVWLGLSILGVLLLLSLVHLFLSTAGRSSLIKGLLMAEDNYDDKSLTFKGIWTSMKPYFWRLLLLRFVLGLAVFVLGALLGLLFLFMTIATLGLALCLILPIGLLAIPICMLVSAIVAYASIALVDEDLGVFKAIARSWEVVTNNVWSVLLIILIYALIGIVTVIAIVLPLLIAGLPLVITTMRSAEVSPALWVVFGILMLIAFVWAVLVSMWSNTLVHGMFVITWRRLRYQTTTPFKKNMLAMPATAAAEPRTQEEFTPAEESGNEPASQEPDVVNPEH